MKQGILANILFIYLAVAYYCNATSFSIKSSEAKTDQNVLTNRTIYVNNFAWGIDTTYLERDLNINELSHLKHLDFSHIRVALPWNQLINNSNSQQILQEKKELFQAFKRVGIQPVVVLFDVQLDPELAKNFWNNPSVLNSYYSYSKHCYEYLDAEVDMWITFENQHLLIDHPSETLLRKILLAHASVAKLFHINHSSRKTVGIGINGRPTNILPIDSNKNSQFLNNKISWFLDPLFQNDGYSKEMKQLHQEQLPEFNSQELLLLKESCDFLFLTHHLVGKDLESVLTWVNEVYDQPDLYIVESTKWNHDDGIHVHNIKSAIFYGDANIRGFFTLSQDNLPKILQTSIFV